MISLIFIILLLLIHSSSSSEQCPVLNSCTCSTDLTIVKCTDQQLTNEFLLKLNNQLTNSTRVLNLSSNSFTSIKSLSKLSSLQILDISSNKIRYLPSNIFSKYPRLISLYIQETPLRNLPKYFRNFSLIHLNLSDHFPRNHLQQSQIIHENEQIILNCSSNSPHYWTLNGQFYPSTILSSTYSTILIHHLQVNQSGIWTCRNSQSMHHSISLTVLANSSNYFCQSTHMNTSKGYFYWPRTLINQRVETKCPHGSAAWLGDSNKYARAWYTCSSNGQWRHFDISQCGYRTNISRVLDYLSLDENNLLLHLVKYLAGINRSEMKLNDILLLIDLIDEQQEKFQNQDRIMLIYHLTDFILQTQFDFLREMQYQHAMRRLRLIIQRLLDLTNQSWLYIGKELTAMTLQSPLSSTLCFVSNRSLLTINCDMHHHQQQSKSQLVSMTFPAYSNLTNQYSLFRIIVYRQSIFFPSTENNPVVYIRPVSRNSFSTVRLTFSDPSEEVSIGVWYSNDTEWQRKSSSCRITEQNDDFLSSDCILSNNNSLSITYFNNKNLPTSIFLNQKYSQLIIRVSSIIATMCFVISMVFYMCFHRISPIPRSHFHCLMNYWMNLSILFPFFAFGIEQNQYPFLCHFIGITLHYLCLTTIIWLTLLTYSIWRKLYIISSDKDEERKSSLIRIDDHTDEQSKSKPVIQFYLLAYGLALMICGINVLISREKNLINKICFLNHFHSMLILIISLLIFIFLLLMFLLFARNYIKTLFQQSGMTVNEVLANRNSRHSYLLTIDHQYKSINQLLAILSQLVLLIFLFLSTLAIYLRPLRALKLRFEHIIYSHFYAFFLLFLACYILSFHVLSRIYYYFHSKKLDQDELSNQSLFIDQKESEGPSSLLSERASILPQSYSQDSSSKHVGDISENTVTTDDQDSSSKRLINIASKYYICHEQILKTNSSQNIPHDPIVHETDGSDRQSTKRSINIPIEYHTMPAKSLSFGSSPLVSSRSFTHSLVSPSQAIIRSLPIIRLSLPNPPSNLSNSIDTIQSNNHHSSSIVTTSSTEEYNIIQENISSCPTKSAENPVRVLYIDEDDERSVSLISSSSNSQTSSYTLIKRNRSQTLSNSSSSASSNYSIDYYSFPLKIHETSV